MGGGAIDEIQSGCQSKNFGEIFNRQISAAITEKSLLFNIFKSIHDNVPRITINTIIKYM